MFFFTRRRERPLPRVPFFGCATRLLLPRPRRLALAGDAHSPGALAAAGVGLGSLSPDRKAAPVAEPTVGADLGQPLDVLGALAAQVPLHLFGLDRLAKLHDLVVGQVLDVGVRIHPGALDELAGGGGADSVDVGEAHLDALVERDVYASDTSQISPPATSTLPLLVARVRADDQHDAAPPNHPATLAHRLYGRSNLHRPFAGSYPITFRRRPTGPMNRARGHKKTAPWPIENGSRAVTGGPLGLAWPTRTPTVATTAPPKVTWIGDLASANTWCAAGVARSRTWRQTSP